ncbi:MAG: hypothetical protein IT168_24595 [Bryobacterales bacterium]|nr:hypothetical protein [Bryobacterales bacterium]
MTVGSRPKIYCYVDETGQDTIGAFFIAAVVVAGASRDAMIVKIEEIERTSGKGKVKWMKAKRDRRLAFMRSVVATPLFRNSICYSLFHDTTAFLPATVSATRDAIRTLGGDSDATIFVDGLPKSRLHWFGAELRRMGVRVNRVCGVRREEADALMRLADAAAGFVRAALYGEDSEAATLLARAIKNGVCKQA